MFAELSPCVVQSLVESAAVSVQPLGQDVDRDAVQGERDEHTSLVRRQHLCDRALQSLEQLALLGLGVGLEARTRKRPQPSGSSGTSRPCQARFRSFTAASRSANL